MPDKVLYRCRGCGKVLAESPEECCERCGSTEFDKEAVPADHPDQLKLELDEQKA